MTIYSGFSHKQWCLPEGIYGISHFQTYLYLSFIGQIQILRGEPTIGFTVDGEITIFLVGKSTGRHGF